MTAPPQKTSTRSWTPVRPGLLQRKCACGGTPGPSGECDECRKKRLQRQIGNTETNNRDNSLVPPIVHEVLRSPSQPLDSATRAFMEPRFGHDFSQVRVHTDGKAAESARAIGALAYTAGGNVVFGEGQHSPNTYAGKHLIAHELAHVVQQGDRYRGEWPEVVSSPGDESEQAAEAAASLALHDSVPRTLGARAFRGTLFRSVGAVNCPPGVFGAPADPRADLVTVDPIAVSLANQAADSLATDSVDVKGGIDIPSSASFQSYQDHFGLPNAAGGGFLNRLTGVVRPTQEIAASEELNILSRRFRFSARLFSERVSYRCPGNAVVTLPGCAPGSCGTAFAFSCRGGLTIALCQPFWDQLGSAEAKAAALIHESMHIMFGESGLSLAGEIGETTQRGPGRNFNVAGCYEFIIDDIAGVNSLPVCPPVP